MDPQDLGTAGPVGGLHRHAAVEATGTQQRRIEYIGAVGRGEHDHRLTRIEAIHLHQQLIQRLLALIVAADDIAAAAPPPDRIQLVHEDDRRGRLLRLIEKVAHTRRTDTDDHLDELRAAHREERHASLAGRRARQQRLAGAGRRRSAARPSASSAKARILVGVLEEIDDLDQFVLDFIDPRDILRR